MGPSSLAAHAAHTGLAARVSSTFALGDVVLLAAGIVAMVLIGVLARVLLELVASGRPSDPLVPGDARTETVLLPTAAVGNH
jgi:hypothetical protein